MYEVKKEQNELIIFLSLSIKYVQTMESTDFIRFFGLTFISFKASMNYP